MIDKRKTEALGVSVNKDLSPIEVYFDEKLPLSKIAMWTKFSTHETKKNNKKNTIFLGIMKLFEIL